MSMQWRWKAWRQVGRRRRSSRGRKGERQTAQSGDLGRTAEGDERETSGKEEMDLFLEDGGGGDVAEVEVRCSVCEDGGRGRESAGIEEVRRRER